MSAHNAIDDLLVRLADIDGEIWQRRQALLGGHSAAAGQLEALENRREALLRDAEIQLLFSFRKRFPPPWELEETQRKICVLDGRGACARGTRSSADSSSKDGPGKHLGQ